MPSREAKKQSCFMSCCHLTVSHTGAFLAYFVKCCRECLWWSGYLWGHKSTLGVTSPRWSLTLCSHSVPVLSCARDNSSPGTQWVGLTYAPKIIRIAKCWCEIFLGQGNKPMVHGLLLLWCKICQLGTLGIFDLFFFLPLQTPQAQVAHWLLFICPEAHS